MKSLFKMLVVFFIGVFILSIFDSFAEEVKKDSETEYFLGYETDPSMEYGGRDIMTLHLLSCRAFGAALNTENSPKLAMTYEIPLGMLIWGTVQHEVNGHGGRGREFDLGPVYGAGLGFSAYTAIQEDPESNEQIIVLAAGGTESNGILAHRGLIDAFRDWEVEGALVPLIVMSKWDLSLYIYSTADPGKEDNQETFTEQYEEGNDIAIYLVSRQGHRKNADEIEVWERDYTIDFEDELLEENYNDLQTTALWCLIDPATLCLIVNYVADHVRKGQNKIRPFVLEFGSNFGISVGTRGAIGPNAVTRFLDFYFLSPFGVLNIYGRDLDSSEDTTYGYGGGFYSSKLYDFISISFKGDFWENPESEEDFYDETGWNISGELEMTFFQTMGFSVKAGSKSEGFFPGTPVDDGFYMGAGLRYIF